MLILEDGNFESVSSIGLLMLLDSYGIDAIIKINPQLEDVKDVLELVLLLEQQLSE